MSDKEILKTIQNDIKNIDKCIEMCDSEESIDYLKSIKMKLLQILRKEEIKIVKKMAIKKALKEKQHEHTNIQPTKRHSHLCYDLQ